MSRDFSLRPGHTNYAGSDVAVVEDSTALQSELASARARVGELEVIIAAHQHEQTVRQHDRAAAVSTIAEMLVKLNLAPSTEASLLAAEAIVETLERTL